MENKKLGTIVKVKLFNKNKLNEIFVFFFFFY
jgi:hypothetical protein